MTYKQLIFLTILIFSLCASSYAQNNIQFSFPSPVAHNATFSNYASRNNPTWRDFRDVVNHPIYGNIGKAVGRLQLSYEGQSSFRLYDDGNCTATILNERLLLTNAHCVYSPRFSRGAGEEIRLTNLALAMNVHAANQQGDVYLVKIEPVEINTELDFAILEFAAASPYEKYGAVDLSNHRSASVGETLFMVHHSNITGRFDGNNYKRLTDSNCSRLNATQFNRNNVPVLLPDEENVRPVNPQQDVPHFCDSEWGSSGSLIYARDDNAVVGLHFAGFDAPEEADRFNLYIDIEVLCRESRVLSRFCGQSDDATALIRTSEELVRRAAQGGRLELAAVTFRLDETLELRGDVQLIGQGYERTRIVSSAREAVVRYRGGGTFTARGVGFARDGGEGDVVHVADGDVAMDACQFMGGVYLDVPNSAYWGAGIALKGNSRGTIRNSQVNDNSVGIVVSDSAQSQLEQNRIHENEGSGIYYSELATGSVIDNEIFANGTGIFVFNNTKPQLEQNRIHENGTGIFYGDSAAGSMIDNEIFANYTFGIVVWDNAQPRLEQNRIHENRGLGIYYSESAAGSASNNQIYNNGGAGITLYGSANPTLSNNTFYGNRDGAISDER